MKNVLLLFVAILCCASAIIWMKLSTIDYALLAALRCLLAAAILAPLAIRDFRRRVAAPLPLLRRACLPGALLGLHFVLWIYGARQTLAANASLIANMVPLVMPLFLYVALREIPTRREALGTLIALSGVGLLATASAVPGTTYMRGNFFCFLSMICLTGYLALGRANRDFPTIWTYVVPVYAIAGLTALVAVMPRLGQLAPVASLPREMLWLAALTLLPTVIGHSLINLSMQRLRGQTVAVANLSQFIFSALFAYLAPGLREVPQPAFYGAAALICTGVGITLRAKRQTSPG